MTGFLSPIGKGILEFEHGKSNQHGKFSVMKPKPLLDSLNEVALFPSLSPRLVPLGFPIRVKDRDRIRQALFNHEIYPRLRWPIKGIVLERFRDGNRLSAEIMTLPCDQRYNRSDMERKAGRVSRVF